MQNTFSVTNRITYVPLNSFAKDSHGIQLLCLYISMCCYSVCLHIGAYILVWWLCGSIVLKKTNPKCCIFSKADQFQAIIATDSSLSTSGTGLSSGSGQPTKTKNILFVVSQRSSHHIGRIMWDTVLHFYFCPKRVWLVKKMSAEHKILLLQKPKADHILSLKS